MPICRQSVAGLFVAFCGVLLAGCAAPDAIVAGGATAAPASAGTDGNRQIIDGFIVDNGPPQPADARGRYYVEFRSRWLMLYGHTYVVYGRLDQSDRPLDQHFAALYPRGDWLGLTAGSLPVMVPATTKPVWGDGHLGTLASFRRTITPSQYEEIERFVYRARSHPIAWNLYTQNCNYFAGQIAQRIGLKTPPLSTQVTPLYVLELEKLNREI